MNDTLTMDKLEGKEVLTKDGRRLGVLAGARIDPNSWCVSALTVRLDRDVVSSFGMARKIFGSHEVGIRTSHISAISDALILNTTLAELERSHEVEVSSGEQSHSQANPKRVKSPRRRVSVGARGEEPGVTRPPRT